MTMYEFWHYVAAELHCGWSVIFHGPEFWLGVAIWGVGACCGIVFSWAMVALGDRMEEKRNESAAPAVDRTAERPGRDDGGSAADSESGGQQ